jgi:hypothetical protein
MKAVFAAVIAIAVAAPHAQSDRRHLARSAEGPAIPLLPSAKKIMDARQSKDDPQASCLPSGVPRIAPYPWRIAQTLRASSSCSKQRLQIVEHCTRKDEHTLVNQITIDDPGAYARPFTVTFTAELAPAGAELMEYICSENNQDASRLHGPPTEPGDPDRPPGTLKAR